MDGTASPVSQGVFYRELDGTAILRFNVYGTPKPKARPRVVRNPKTNFVHTYTPATTVNWEQTIVWHAKQYMAALSVEDPEAALRMPYTGRIMADVRFNVVKPKSAPKSVHFPMKAQPGDVDNLAKSVLDALQIAGVIQDDKTVTDLSTAKRFVSEGHDEGVEIELTVCF
ncbi:MAG TPA: RusA family crossover junction endodeoxyribonuclease [Acidimicrobiales bacterium]|nr:RusA family crossover junction endodeoxyribonuclease [Acidimicrobiales bacterium]